MALEERLVLPSGIEPALREKHYQLYLAQCLERRLVNEGYLTPNHPGKFKMGRLFYHPDDIISYKEIGRATGKNPSVLFSFAEHRHLRAPENITVANGLKSGLFLIKRDYGRAFTDEEMAEKIYFTATENIAEMSSAGYFERRREARTKRVRQTRIYFGAFELVVEMVRRSKSLQGKSLEQVKEILQLDPLEVAKESAGEYSPNVLFSDFWIVYRLGASPRDTRQIDEYRKIIFCQPELQPTQESRGHKKYRAGDFKNEDFAPWKKTVVEVFTNPYLGLRNPRELVGVAQVARELGIGTTQAKRMIRKVKDAPITGKRGVKLYERITVHEQLGLPGTLLLTPEQGQDYAEELIRRCYDANRRLNRKYWGEDVKSLAEIAGAKVEEGMEAIFAFVKEHLFSTR